MPVTLICAYIPCSQSFTVKPYKADKSRFCSHECFCHWKTANQLATFWDRVQICSHGIDCPYCCWPFEGETDSIYRHIYVHDKAVSAHRLAWELWNKRQIPEGLHIAHYCHRRPCCNFDHLHAATREGNYADSIRDHRLRAGERHHNSKLTKETVLRAFHLNMLGWSNKAIAKDLDVNPATIDHLMHGLTWKDIPRPDALQLRSPGWPLRAS